MTDFGHGRLQFADVAERLPEKCRHVLEALAMIYRNDAAKPPHANPKWADIPILICSRFTAAVTRV